LDVRDLILPIAKAPVCLSHCCRNVTNNLVVSVNDGFAIIPQPIWKKTGPRPKLACMRGRGIKAVAMLLASLACIGTAIAQDLPTLLSRFQSERDRSTKEMILYSITKDYPASGSALLRIARQTEDTDTRWLAIRGMGWLKFNDAAPF
jgi:hypothetical protein